MTGDAVEQLRHMELSESDLAQLDLPDPWWKKVEMCNRLEGGWVGGCFFFFRFEMFLPLKAKERYKWR